MLSAADLESIRRHTAIIGRFSAEREEEENRLRTRDEARAREIAQVIFNEPAGINFDRDPAIDRDAREMHERLMAGLAAFDRVHRPDVQPFDTPRELVEYIDEKLSWIGWRRAALLASHPLGPDALKSNGWEHRPGGPPDYPNSEARDYYREGRRRALAFVRIAPSLRECDELKEHVDPVQGLLSIKALFETMVPDGPAAQVGPADGIACEPPTPPVVPVPPPSAGNKRRRENDARNRWCYEIYETRPTADLIILGKKEHPEWEWDVTVQAICNAVRIYADRHGLPRKTRQEPSASDRRD